MSNKDSFLSIIKNALKQALDVERSSEDGRVNLVSGLLLTFVLGTIILGTSVMDYFILLFYREYQFGIPWYAKVIMFILLGIYFAYCVKKVAESNKNRNSKLEDRVIEDNK